MPDIYTVSNPKVLIYQLMAINNYNKVLGFICIMQTAISNLNGNLSIYR